MAAILVVNIVAIGAYVINELVMTRNYNYVAIF